MKNLFLKTKKIFNYLQNNLQRNVSEQNHDENILKQNLVWAKSLTWVLIGTTVSFLGWLSIAKTDEILVVQGKLEPIGKVKEIQIPMGGVARELLVEGGDLVEKGQVLIKLDAEISKQNLLSILEQLEQKNSQLKLKLEEIEIESSLNKEEIKGNKMSLQLEKELFQKYKKLYENGALSEVEYLLQKNKVDQSRIIIDKKLLEGKKKESSLTQQLKELESSISSLMSQKIAADVNLSYQSIKSPVNGIVFDLKPTNVGFVAQTSQPVMKIVPLENLEANVLVPSNKIGFVRKDMKADISIDSFPASDFGVLEGSVSFIGSDALPPNQTQQINTFSFPVTINLSEQYLNLKSGKNLPLQTGMSISANIKLRKVSYLRLLLSNFKSKADSLKKI